MGKLNELIKLIEKTHPEWKKLSIRKLSEASGYKKWACEEYFKKYPKDKIKTIPKKVSSSSDDTTKGGVSKVSPQSTKIDDDIIDGVDETTVERGLVRLWNLGEINTNLLRCMVDYVIKIKGKSDEVDDDLDLEVLKEIGIKVKTGN